MDVQDSDSPAHRSSHVNLGRFLIALGVAGVLRLIPEAVSFGVRGQSTYVRILAMDAVLGILTLVGGWGLIRGRVWGIHTAVSAGGSMLVNSIAWGILLYPEIHHDWLEWQNGNAPLNRVAGFGARMLFYAVTTCFWPLGLRILMRGPINVSQESHTTSWICLVGSILVSGAVVWLIYRRLC
jgi:hypothetical protein